jgi:hypothetical protein
MKVRRHSTFPQQTGKVKKKRCAYIDTWSSLWKEKNVELEKSLSEDLNLYWLSRKYFHVWDNIHYLQAW